MLTSSSSFALIGHRTLELYYLCFFIYLFIYFFYLTVVRGRRSSEGGLKMEEKTQVYEVGFEPGTFRSCVEHSNHYATEARPIPDVLIVLLNNVPITMTSYDTHTTRHLSDTTIHAKSHHRVSPLAPLTWDRCELHQPVLFTVTTPHCSPSPPRTVRRSDHLRFRSLPVPITYGSDHFRFPPRTLRRPTAPTHGPPFAASPHCSPASLPVSITSGSDHLRFRSLPVPITYGSDHFRFPPRTLRRPVTDLGLNVSDNIRCDVINSYLLTLQIWGLLSATYLLLVLTQPVRLFCFPPLNFTQHDFSK